MNSDINCFIAAVESSSLREAADRLGVTKSTVSRAVKRLEDELDTILFSRERKRLEATKEARIYYRFAKESLAVLHDGRKTLNSMRTGLQGELRVSAPLSFGQAFVSAACVDFSILYPGVSIDLHLSNEMVDVRGDDFDVAVRATGTLTDEALSMRKLGRFDMITVANPDGWAQISQSEHLPIIRFVLPSGRLAPLASPPRPLRTAHRANDFQTIVKFVKRQPVIAVAARDLVARELSEGALIPVLPDWHHKAASVFALYPKEGKRRTIVSLFLDHLSGQFLRVRSDSATRT